MLARMRRLPIFFACSAVAIVVGCGEAIGASDAGGGMDAGGDGSSGERDGAPIDDAGTEDGGPIPIPTKDAGPDLVDGGPGEIDGGPVEIDSGIPSPIDSGPPIDTGTPSPIDSGTDSGMTPDAGPMCATPPEGPPPFPGCNPTEGIECDGDWSDRCSPACSASQCCSPQRNGFACVPRGVGGSCPAADLWVDPTRLAPYIETRTFGDGACAILEGCVGGAGTRRLLRFDTWTPNTGGADMFLGVPSPGTPYFEYSSCHGHYHFNSYAEYELLSSDESCVAAVGHKQAFCLLDYYEYPCSDTGAGGVPLCSFLAGGYTCGNQGIRRNAQDVYDASLDCQWIDITDVPAGDYVIRIRVNTEHILNESSYDNNEIRVPFSIPPTDGATGIDISAPCATPTSGINRDCDFTRSFEGTCVAGASVEVGCSSACGLGSCVGDTIMRVCEAALGSNCTIENDLETNDDSGCGLGPCGGTGDCCSRVTFTCPPTGAYTVWTGAYDGVSATSCIVAAR